MKRRGGRRRGGLRAGALWVGAVLVAAAGCERAEPPREGPVVARVEALPDSVRIGEPVRLRFEVRAPLGHAVRFAPQPPDDSTWTWQSWSLGRPATSGSGVHHELLATALAFRTGRLAVPRAPYRVTAPDGRVSQGEFPALTVAVGSVLPADDPRPDIRREKPPLSAPWWTRVPWVWIAAGLAVAALAWWLWRRRPRRVRGEAGPVAAAVAARPAHLVALEALAALAAERLPERGHWYEHQSRLSEILRRFVEARFTTPLPGHTSRELCLHLAWRGLDAAAVERLSGLLRTADLAKFARHEPSVETAHALEREAEHLVRAWAEEPQTAAASGPPPEAAAGSAR